MVERLRADIEVMWTPKTKQGANKRRCYGQANRQPLWLSCGRRLLCKTPTVRNCNRAATAGTERHVPDEVHFDTMRMRKNIIPAPSPSLQMKKESDAYSTTSCTSFVHLDWKGQAERENDSADSTWNLSLLLQTRMAMRNLQRCFRDWYPRWLFHVGGSAVITGSPRWEYPGRLSQTDKARISGSAQLIKTVCNLAHLQDMYATLKRNSSVAVLEMW